MKEHVRKYKQVVSSYGRIVERNELMNPFLIVSFVTFLTEAEKVSSMNKITHNKR